MFWEDDDGVAPAEQSSTIVELSFALRGRALPPAYANALVEGLDSHLMGSVSIQDLGVRVTHLPEAGHGWWRDKEQPILLSRRARLVLRLERELAAKLESLSGAMLSVGGERLRLESPKRHELAPAETLYAHRVIDLHDNQNSQVSGQETNNSSEQMEREFMLAASNQLRSLEIRPRRMLCGRRDWLSTPHGWLATRSLLVDGMGAHAGLRLQEHGLGWGSAWGCGVFVLHKAVV